MHKVSLRDLEREDIQYNSIRINNDEKMALLQSYLSKRNYGSEPSLAQSASVASNSISVNSSFSNLSNSRRMNTRLLMNEEDSILGGSFAQLRVSLLPRNEVLSAAQQNNAANGSIVIQNVPPLNEGKAMIQKLLSPSQGFSSIMFFFFVIALGFNNWQLASLKQNPSVGPTDQVLNFLGAKNADKIRDKGEFWRLITSQFLHSGLLQLLINMYLLRKAGQLLEKEYGYSKFIALFLLSGISGYLVSCTLDPYSLSSGAAPSISGLYGAIFVHTYQHWSLIENPGSQIAVYLADLTMELVCSIFPMNDLTAVFGGFVCGIIASLILIQPEESLKYYGSQARMRKYFVFLLAQTVLVFWFAAWTWLAFKHDPDWASNCEPCKNIGCVSSPLWSCSIGHCVINGTLQIHLSSCPLYST